MASDPPLSPSDKEYRLVVEQFKCARDENTRKDFLGREFVLVPAVTEAVITVLQRLLDACYARNNYKVPRHNATDFPPSARAIFYTLLDLNSGHQFHTFLENGANELPIERTKLIDLFPPDTCGPFAQRFYKQQWRWCPMEFGYRMGIRLTDSERIIPITQRRKIEPARDSVPEADRKATLWVVEVPSELVSEPLKRKLQDEHGEDNDASMEGAQTLSSWRMVVKQFGQSKQAEFDREQDLFNTLGEKPGIVQYLGWYESRQPAPPSSPSQREPDPEVYYNLVLELGDQDLYSAFQKENPPVHFQEIRDFWRSLFDVADALASIQTIKRKNFTDYVWHGDIKPENILDVETGFKLADPGEAAVVQVGIDKDIDIRSLKTSVPGGTRTFAAPEKTAYKSGEPEPQVTQAIDIWSLGCVFSVAATYVVLGKEGVKQYRLFRRKAIRERNVNSFGDSFHDGNQVLPEVLTWHKYLVACLRKDDIYTSKVLDVVDQYMLITPGEARITGADLSVALQGIHEAAGRHAPQHIPKDIESFLTCSSGSVATISP